jgi:hypothetical protein
MSPIRLLMSIVGTICITMVLIGVGLWYPISVHMNGDPVTAISCAVPFLTILAVFTMFYAPCYFFGFGFLGLAIFGMLCEHGDVDTNPAMAFFASGDGWTLVGIIFAFLAIGIIQRYIRHRMFDPPKEKHLGFVDQLNQVRLERRTREYDAMNPELRATMTNLHGDNYLTWPE